MRSKEEHLTVEGAKFRATDANTAKTVIHFFDNYTL